MTADQRRPAPHAVEPLERRTLFSLGTPAPGVVTEIEGWTFSVTTRGTLLIQGDDSANTLFVEQGSRFLAVGTAAGAQDALFDLKTVKRVYVEGAGGADRITTRSRRYDLPTTVIGGAGNDTIVGQAGQTLVGAAHNDFIDALAPPTIVTGGGLIGPQEKGAEIFGGPGNDTLTGSGGPDTISGGKGTDIVVRSAVGLIDVNNPVPGAVVDSVELLNTRDVNQPFIDLIPLG